MTDIRTQEFVEMNESGGDLGNFYPRGHIFAAFSEESFARAAERQLQAMGFEGDGCRYVSAEAVEAATQRGLDTAGGLAMTGASLKLVDQYNRLSKQGYHFLLITADSDKSADAIAETLRANECRLARRYRTLAVETLI